MCFGCSRDLHALKYFLKESILKMRCKPAERGVGRRKYQWMSLCLIWFLWSQRGWVQVSCSISDRGGFLHTMHSPPSHLVTESCAKAAQEKPSGCRRGWNPSLGVLYTAPKTGSTISTGHQNKRPTQVSSKDWLTQTATDWKSALGKEVRERERRKTCSHCFNLYYTLLISAPCPLEVGFFHYIKWKGRKENHVKFTRFFFQ